MTTLYRFVTQHRIGKWYSDLTTAQAQACTIGAGFLDPRTGRFFQYAGVRLERSNDGTDDAATGDGQHRAVA